MAYLRTCAMLLFKASRSAFPDLVRTAAAAVVACVLNPQGQTWGRSERARSNTSVKLCHQTTTNCILLTETNGLNLVHKFPSTITCSPNFVPSLCGTLVLFSTNIHPLLLALHSSHPGLSSTARDAKAIAQFLGRHLTRTRI